MNAARRNAEVRLVMPSRKFAGRAPLPRSWIEAAAMTLVGLPMAILIAVIAHRVFHYGLTSWLGAVICFLAAAISKTATNLYLRQFAQP